MMVFGLGQVGNPPDERDRLAERRKLERLLQRAVDGNRVANISAYRVPGVPWVACALSYERQSDGRAALNLDGLVAAATTSQAAGSTISLIDIGNLSDGLRTLPGGPAASLVRDVEAALAASGNTLSFTQYIERSACTPMEGKGVHARWDADDRSLRAGRGWSRVGGRYLGTSTLARRGGAVLRGGSVSGNYVVVMTHGSGAVVVAIGRHRLGTVHGNGVHALRLPTALKGKLSMKTTSRKKIAIDGYAVTTAS